jgi:hypothetical protein
MRILVTGSRELTDMSLVSDAIGTVTMVNDKTTIVVGDCPTGADAFARELWELDVQDDTGSVFGDRIEIHKANWATHGKAAGPLRNQAMVDSGVDLCLAFYKTGAGNRGTRDCVIRAKAAGIPVIEHWEEP